MGFFSERIGKLLGDFIGTFIEYDASNKSSLWRDYMRIKVSIDVTEPLKRWKKIKKADGSTFTAMFKYEKLYHFCFACGQLGHTESFCGDLFDASKGKVAEKGRDLG